MESTAYMRFTILKSTRQTTAVVTVMLEIWSAANGAWEHGRYRWHCWRRVRVPKVRVGGDRRLGIFTLRAPSARHPHTQVDPKPASLKCWSVYLGKRGLECHHDRFGHPDVYSRPELPKYMDTNKDSDESLADMREVVRRRPFRHSTLCRYRSHHLLQAKWSRGEM